MTTSHDVFATEETSIPAKDRDAVAREAVKEFRKLQGTLTAYARILTGNQKMRVEVSSTSNGATDGERIYYRPPLSLGLRPTHDRGVCNKRDHHLRLRCPACRAREAVLVTIYHEIAHLAFGSMADVSEEDLVKFTVEAVKKTEGHYATAILARINMAPWHIKNKFMPLAHMISEWFPILLNAIEDARVNRMMFNSRPGTKIMFDGQVKKIMDHGVLQPDNTHMKWSEYPQNHQVLVGVFCMASNYDIKGWFHPKIEKDLHDPELGKLMARVGKLRNVSGSYHLAFPVLARLRELGYCVLPEDPEEPEKDDEPEPEFGGAGEPPEDSTEEPPEGDDADPGESGSEDGAGEAESDGDPDPDEGDGDSESGSGSSEEGSEESSGSGEGSPGSSGPGGEESQSDNGDSGSGEPDAGSSGEPDGADESGGDDPSSADAGDDQGGDGSSTGETEGTSSGSSSGGSSSGEPDGRNEKGSGGGSFSPMGDRDLHDDGESERGDEPADSEGVQEDDDLHSGGEGADGREEGGDSDGPAADSGEASESSVEENSTDEGSSDDSGSGDSNAESSDDEDSSDNDSDGSAAGHDAGSTADDDGADGTRDGSPAEADGSSESAGSSPDSGKDKGKEGTNPDDEWTPPEAEEGEEALDTGADLGKGGISVEYEDGAEVALPMGTPEEGKAVLLKLGDHEHTDPPSKAAAARTEKELEGLFGKAIVQSLYFETGSTRIAGVREHYYDTPLLHSNGDFASTGWEAKAGIVKWSGYSLVSAGVEGDFDPVESILSPALARLRKAFADNAVGGRLRHRSSGRVDRRALGKRAPIGDDRLFYKKKEIVKKDYFVIIAIDISGSTFGQNLMMAKKAALAQAVLLHRLGIKFAVYAHSAYVDIPNYDAGMNLDIYHVKDEHEPWNDKIAQRLKDLCPAENNLDGHSMEYYRKVAEKSKATDRVIMYYTDGEMPAENYTEELFILRREIKYCKERDITLMGVGIRTDSPIKHGLDTVRIDEDRDVIKVVTHLEKRLTGR